MPRIPSTCRALGLLLQGGLLLGLSSACGTTPSSVPKATERSETGSPPEAEDRGDCDPSRDTDGDGLDDCTEQELGTDPARADTDGDGLTDAEELACVSSPTDPEELCYACGWPHGDPGDLTGVGTGIGSTIENLSLVDQCGERVALWDLAGSWHLLYMTAAWCAPCLEAATQFEATRAELVARTALPFSFVTVVYEDRSGSLPDAEEARLYAEAAGITSQPVFADPVAAVLTATPPDGSLLPGVCVLGPRMELVACASGETAVEELLAVVESSTASGR